MNIPKLRGYLAERKITQAAVAKHIGCSSSAANRKVNGISPFTLEEAEALANATGMNSDDFAIIFLSSGCVEQRK